jgi:thiol:disulfide interchange protein
MVKRSNRTAPMHLTENTFDEVVAASDGLLMVDFSADWCAPCRAREAPCNGEPRGGDRRIDSVRPSGAPRRRAE